MGGVAVPFKQTKGACRRIISQSECQAEAVNGVVWKGATTCSSKTCAPAGCYVFNSVKGKRLYYNTNKSGQCTRGRACLCAGTKVAHRATGRCIGGNALSSACSKITTQSQCTTKLRWWSLGMGTCRWVYLGKTVAGKCHGNTMVDGSCTAIKSSTKCLAKKNWFGVVMCHWK